MKYNTKNNAQLIINDAKNNYYLNYLYEMLDGLTNIEKRLINVKKDIKNEKQNYTFDIINKSGKKINEFDAKWQHALMIVRDYLTEIKYTKKIVRYVIQKHNNNRYKDDNITVIKYNENSTIYIIRHENCKWETTLRL